MCCGRRRRSARRSKRGRLRSCRFLKIDEAQAAARRLGARTSFWAANAAVRGSKGSILGNSPAEYTAEAVGGTAVFITTTNGTRALDHARLAAESSLAPCVNLSAVVESVKTEPRIDILCAGTDGEETLEDTAGRGAIDRSADGDAAGRLAAERCGDAARCASGGCWWQGRPFGAIDRIAAGGEVPRQRLAAAICIEVGNDGDLPICAGSICCACAASWICANGRITVPSVIAAVDACRQTAVKWLP